jgi:hypothetical protein
MINRMGILRPIPASTSAETPLIVREDVKGFRQWRFQEVGLPAQIAP